jgi:hypothetical protein
VRGGRQRRRTRVCSRPGQGRDLGRNRSAVNAVSARPGGRHALARPEACRPECTGCRPAAGQNPDRIGLLARGDPRLRLALRQLGRRGRPVGRRRRRFGRRSRRFGRLGLGRGGRGYGLGGDRFVGGRLAGRRGDDGRRGLRPRRRGWRRFRSRSDGRHRARRRRGGSRWFGFRVLHGLQRRPLRRPRGQEPERIEVPVRVRGQSDAEMDVRRGDVGAGRADRPDHRALRHGAVALDSDRGEMDEGDRVPVAGCDRHRQAVGRNGAGERDRATPGRQDRFALRAADGDAAVLAARVRVGAELELLQHRPRGRPRPGTCRRRKDEEQQSGGADRSQWRQHVVHGKETRSPLSNLVTL